MKVEKYYCDVCGGDMEESSSQLTYKGLKFKKKSVDFFISGGMKNSDVCKYCLIDMANTFDDRDSEQS